jgi:hypothetical protein
VINKTIAQKSAIVIRLEFVVVDPFLASSYPRRPIVSEPERSRRARYLVSLLRTHSATPVSRPSMNSGSNHSVDAPNRQATSANVQQEPVIHKPIARVSGSFSMRDPLRAGHRISSRSRPSRPIGVISPKAFKGEPHPLLLF